MKEFSSKLTPQNKAKFSELWYDRNKCYLRRDLYEHILSQGENNYFSLDQFNQKVQNLELVKKMATEIIPELVALGWKCKLSFGGTGLFIYSSEKPPPNCWDE